MMSNLILNFSNLSPIDGASVSLVPIIEICTSETLAQAAGAQKASAVANGVLARVREKMGYE